MSGVLRDRLASSPSIRQRRQLETTLESGLLAGIASAVVTASLLALAGELAGVGPFAPFYAIVSILDPGPLEVARTELDQGVAVSFFQQQFVGGFGICLVLGAVSGVVFALGVLRYRLNAVTRCLVGAIHGVLMMCLFYVGALQVVGALLGIRADTLSLSNLLGWPALVLVHAVHGVVVAAVVRTRVASGEPMHDSGVPPLHS